jgi:EmrB/QacA subfamily drug resistance transporter
MADLAPSLPEGAADADAPDPPAPLAGRQLAAVFGGLLLAMLLAALDSTIVATALPTIVGEFGGIERLAWVVTAYLLAQTVVTPLYGKLGDIHGRKRVLQVAVVVFLVGSALCGAATSMPQLILFRFVQGLGGGGLMVTAQAVVGDVVTPRERGKYQGIFGAVFAVASIAGPLLGGYFTTHLSWRWIFYINLPLGVLALLVIAAALPAAATRVRRAIDWAGAGLLAAALASLVVLTDLGGTTYPWGSAPIVALAVTAAATLVAFVLVERRAAEPVLPPRLFADRTFAVASAVGLIVGFALFGAVTYLPLWLQVAKGESPTASGLRMLPMMGGTIASSILSGQLISRTGRYKLFPILGTALATVGLVLLSRLEAGTSLGSAAVAMLVLGLGLGLVMQVLVLAVQNSVSYRDLGVATSGAMLFRLVGGSLGTAVLGAIFAARLGRELAARVPAGGAVPTGGGHGIDPAAVARLPEAARLLYAEAVSASLGTMFLVAACIAATGFAIALAMPERPLRKSVAAAASASGEEAGEAFAMPRAPDAAAELRRGLAVLADRDVQRQWIADVVSRAGLTLTPAAAWLLVQLDRRGPGADVEAIGRAARIAPERVRQALDELTAAGYVHGGAGEDAHGGAPVLTAPGCAALGRLVTARRTHLAELLADWEPERHAELAALLRRIAGELVPDVRAPDVPARVS